MSVAANIVIILVILLHIYFMILEIFFWDKPIGLRAFGQSPEAAKATKVLAANQGLYNGFLAAGLTWGLTLGPSGINVIIFFLSCVIAAGIFGAITANLKILYIQAAPALVGLVLVLLT